MRFPRSTPSLFLAALLGLFASFFSTAQAGPSHFAASTTIKKPAVRTVQADVPPTAQPAKASPEATSRSTAAKGAAYPGTVIPAPPASIPPEKLAQLAAPDRNTYNIVVSVAEQKIALVQNGQVIKKYPISTSRFGLGDSYGSYRTPLGQLKICQKLGAGLPEGAVFKHRVPTGEVLPVNSKGRDPIVTRIMWLDGQEAGNVNARGRGIYIHGTPVENQIGKPVSYGCIRMRSRDVVELYDAVPVGTSVTITRGKIEPSSSLLASFFADARRNVAN